MATLQVYIDLKRYSESSHGTLVTINRPISMGSQEKSYLSVAGRDVGRVGFGMMSMLHCTYITSNFTDLLIGLTMPWLDVQLDAAAEVLRKALESGANFWNGVDL